MSSSGRPRSASLSACGLLAVGLVALAGLTVPGRSLLAPTTPAELVTGAAVLDLSSLAVAGGLLVVGVGALAFGLVLLLARVA